MLRSDTLLRSNGLALLIGTHFMANVTQGVPFGLSGRDEARVLRPRFSIHTDWLTSGDFGIEASLLGLVANTVLLVGLYIRLPKGEAAP